MVDLMENLLMYIFTECLILWLLYGYFESSTNDSHLICELP
jgi:hypothetical protein